MRDTAGATSTTTLTVTIHGANDAPALAVQTGSQNATVGSAFSLVLPAGTFTDVDAGDTLTYTATAADGSALPAWLTFNATTALQRHAGGWRCRHARRQGVGHRSRRPQRQRDLQYRRDDHAGYARRRRSPTRPMPPRRAVPMVGWPGATGNVLTNDTDPDAGDTKTVTAVSFGAVSGTLGTALPGAYGSLVLSASGTSPTRSTRRMPPCRRLRQSTDTLTDVFSYTMRDTAGATSSTTLTVTIHGANDAPAISNLAVSATSISFVASDPDNATLSLASPFASAFGNPAITERCHL